MQKKTVQGEWKSYPEEFPQPEPKFVGDPSDRHQRLDYEELWNAWWARHLPWLRGKEVRWQADSPPPSMEPNLTCDCGSETFKVCWWDYPYTGGYCRVVCSVCGEDLTLIDDYA